MQASLHRSLLTLAAAVLVGSPLAADEPQATEDNPAADQPAPAETGQRELQTFLTAHAILLRESVARANALIGVDVTAVDEVLRSHLGLAEGQGAVVAAVSDDSPASRAGIQKNDVLVTVDEQSVTGAEGLQNLLQAAGEKAIKVGLIRTGQKQSLEVTPQAAFVNTFPVALSETVLAAPQYWLGIGLANADDTLRSHLGIAAQEGLVVTSVENESPAVKAGLMVNDLLLKLDGKPLSTIEALTAQLQEIAEKSVPLELLRRGKPATLTVTPEARANQWLTVHLDQPELTFTTPRVADRFFIDLSSDADVDLLIAQPPAPDLAKQVAELLEQVKQFHKSLEVLDAAVKAQPPAPTQASEK